MVERTIGLELEFLAVQLENGLAATREHIKNIWREWSEAAHVELYIDAGTKQPLGVTYTLPDQRTFMINTDGGVCLVEFSFPPFKTIKETEDVMLRVVGEYLEIAKKHGIGLMSYGLQPKTPWYYPDLKTEKQWYRILGHLPFFQMWHNQFHTIAAHQPCIGVNYEEIIPVVNTLNALGGVTIALFANSSVGEWEIQKHHEEREFRWARLVEGYDEKVTRIQGIPSRPFSNFRDYFEYNWGIFMPCIARGKNLHVSNELGLISEFLHGEMMSSFDITDTKPSEISPTITDVNDLNQYIWIQSRPRLFLDNKLELAELLKAYDENTVDECIRDHITNLYVENRNVAGQPWNEIMTAPAYFLGLIENIEKTKAIMESKPWEYWIELREKTIVGSMKVEEVWPYVEQLLQIAKEGLQKRGLGEEIYLTPLFERLEKRESPAMRAIREYEALGMDAFIESRLIKI